MLKVGNLCGISIKLLLLPAKTNKQTSNTQNKTLGKVTYLFSAQSPYPGLQSPQQFFQDHNSALPLTHICM